MKDPFGNPYSFYQYHILGLTLSTPGLVYIITILTTFLVIISVLLIIIKTHVKVTQEALFSLMKMEGLKKHPLIN